MMALFSNIRTRLEKRRAYQRTVAEIKAMPLDVALDLDIYREDAPRIAASAVYR